MFKNKKTLSTILIWVAMQFICMLPASLIMLPVGILTGMDQEDIRYLTVMMVLLLSQAGELIVFRILGYFKFKEIVLPVPRLLTAVSSVIAGISLFYSIDIIQAQFEIPDLLEQDMGKFTETVWGFFAICIIGPIAEEVMMRRIILRDLWRRSGRMWTGILLSALIFAVIHLNPAQVVFAFPAGIILGWLYCATGSLIVPVIIHVLNNTISFISIRTGGAQPDLGDPQGKAILAACLVAGILLVRAVASVSRKNREFLRIDETPETETEPVKGQ
ncbi:MAG: CPBP family intramembrane metalloprotease [Bacteroidaceae bacterium]|nr:CPBP family intramembrane metalloprotease [Bacteroidaceae bacterium]